MKSLLRNCCSFIGVRHIFSCTVRFSHIIFAFVTMNSLVECALRKTLTVRKDLFGEDAIFESFEDEQCYKSEQLQLQSSLRFGRIFYSHRDRGRISKSIFLKVTPSLVLMKDFSMLQFFNEAFFYTRILPLFQTFAKEIGNTFPRYYNSLLQYNAVSDEAVIIFENLLSNGYSPPEKKSFLDVHHLRLMMRKIGEFHAHSYRARKECPTKLDAMMRCRQETNVIVLTKAPIPSLQFGQARGFESLTTDPRYSCRIENLRELLADHSQVNIRILTGDETNRTHILLHGDFMGSNVLFTYEKGKPTNVKIVDLGTWRFGSPVIDLLLPLYLNADQKMRDENWNSLIDEYYVALQSTFPSVEVPSKDSILAEFKTNAVRAYFIASFYLPGLIASDNDDVPGRHDLLPEEYRNNSCTHVPPDLLKSLNELEGGEKATIALSNILKDIIDRGFV